MLAWRSNSSGNMSTGIDDNMASHIYSSLRESEENYRPATNFIEKVQRDVNASMRARTIEELLKVAEKLNLSPDTLYLTVNCMDRYLSGINMEASELTFLAVTCMMIATKYEENRCSAPRVQDFYVILDEMYLKEDVVRMESKILTHLKFDVSAPTTKRFLRLFIRAEQGNEAPKLQEFLLECLSDYIAELSLREYTMLRFAPSVIAASSIFLANFILNRSTLLHYTHYRYSELAECVTELQKLLQVSQSSTTCAIRKKYSQNEYGCIARRFAKPNVPQGIVPKAAQENRSRQAYCQ